MENKNVYEAPEMNVSYFEEPVYTNDASTPGVETPDHWFDN